MKKVLTLAIAALAIVAFAGAGLGQTGPAEKPAKPAPQKMAKAKAKTLTGFVVSVDTEAQTLTVKEASKKQTEHTFTLGQKAAAKVGNLKAGDKISVSYTEAEGKSTANSIKVLKKGKPAA